MSPSLLPPAAYATPTAGLKRRPATPGLSFNAIPKEPLYKFRELLDRVDNMVKNVTLKGAKWNDQNMFGGVLKPVYHKYTMSDPSMEIRAIKLHFNAFDVIVYAILYSKPNKRYGTT